MYEVKLLKREGVAESTFFETQKEAWNRAVTLAHRHLGMAVQIAGTKTIVIDASHTCNHGMPWGDYCVHCVIDEVCNEDTSPEEPPPASEKDPTSADWFLEKEELPPCEQECTESWNGQGPPCAPGWGYHAERGTKAHEASIMKVPFVTNNYKLVPPGVSVHYFQQFSGHVLVEGFEYENPEHWDSVAMTDYSGNVVNSCEVWLGQHVGLQLKNTSDVPKQLRGFWIVIPRREQDRIELLKQGAS